jgi:hypothetical protein
MLCTLSFVDVLLDISVCYYYLKIEGSDSNYFRLSFIFIALSLLLNWLECLFIIIERE